MYRKIENGTYPAVRLSNSPRGPIRVPQNELEEFIFADEDPDAA